MKKYWKSIEEKNQDYISGKEEIKNDSLELNFLNMIEEGTIIGRASRRDFLKFCGYSMTAATFAASCEAPVSKSIPFLIKPEEVVSGIANYYASSFIDGNDYCSIVVKTREGRPIKIEGNELSSITRGGTSARVQASVLSLYDSERLKGPLLKKENITWTEIDNNIKSLLKSFNENGRKIVILSSSIISPSTKGVYQDFIKTFPNTEIVYYDSISSSAILLGNKRCFDLQIIPNYRFDKAEMIVSFGADFLGTWLSPIEYTKQYVQNRKLDSNKNMSRHIQFESGMTLTGSNADERIPIKPSDEGTILINLYNELAKKKGVQIHNINVKIPAVELDSLADELWEKRGKSLLISNSNNVDNQILINIINELLGNYGNTIDLNAPLYLKQGIDSEMESLVSEMEKGNVDALIINNVNPAYDYHDSDRFTKGLSEIKLSISLSSNMDETAELVDYVCPDNHYLESWNDAEPKKNFFSLAQPTINKLFDTRSSQESLLKWMDQDIDYYHYIQQHWKDHLFPLQSERDNPYSEFRSFWNKSLQDGVFEVPSSSESEIQFMLNSSDIQDAIYSLANEEETIFGDIEVQLCENLAIGNGNHANNPWLQELPDPISKVCWDNYASISMADALKYELDNGDTFVLLSSSNKSIELPTLIQPGQAEGTVSIELGYGRTKAGKVGNEVGKNVFPFGHFKNECNQFSSRGNKIIKTNRKEVLAMTQTHHSMEGRDIVKETTLKEYLINPASGNKRYEKLTPLFKEQVHDGYHWGLSIDLNACTGCGNCVIACQAENNVAVIGKDEVSKRRIMHWMRIDRYYSESIDTPKVYHQPVMCQHCDKAPCENVCPVSATMHSNDGLNHMTYNRCVGTRYCMNNCPYKVRRFNWFSFARNDKFDYHMNSDLGRMVLNPDVVVRTVGVAEKCSLCVQRIQEGIGKAKLENRLLVDGDIKPACVQSCPADAIVFGNLNDKESKLYKTRLDERNYHLLEELSILPSVGYLTKVRNK